MVTHILENIEEDIPRDNKSHHRAVTTFMIHGPTDEELFLISRYHYVSVRCHNGKLSSNEERIRFAYFPLYSQVTAYKVNAEKMLEQLPNSFFKVSDRIPFVNIFQANLGYFIRNKLLNQLFQRC